MIDESQTFINNLSHRMSHATRARRCVINMWIHIMKNVKLQNKSTSNESTSNETKHDAHVDAKQINDDKIVNVDIDQIDSRHLIDQRVNERASFVSLKHIIESRKIKCDSKLIRRVLRKYYASKCDHKHRDAWMFATNQIDDVVALIDKHCRANKSSNDTTQT